MSSFTSEKLDIFLLPAKATKLGAAIVHVRQEKTGAGASTCSRRRPVEDCLRLFAIALLPMYY